ncbi:hypothetical protein P4493_04725 [Bacillus thuringiensis]|uniref:Uncharacterized protein n=3 Tax=Bacillus thuringiensis TaxID=1428 RepID=A0A0B5NIH7_BACTU|nr:MULTISPECIES: hypothetical protein [Bacillus]EAO56877.1 hypothetical protein RBTH_07607 [Bacillus thuringiensis serovar israelensis ATCC 35646]MEC2535862.1 hypothetical protein [Bacillus cereus]MED1153703.1 hypothetical protein [Bacillus paranthracis]OUB09423.1 hypothetical protein BK708_33425 [Bacillus thuringiensis serovar yunnanensis]AFQ30023.1 hypothetical protein BTF1_29612 [Bacillus thuringiensis HD-789]
MTETKGFKQSVYDELKVEIENSLTKVIGFSDAGTVVDIASNKSELGSLLKNSNVKGVVADYTQHGSVGFVFKTKRSVVSTNLSPVPELIDFVVEDIKNTISSYSEFEKAVVSSNRFNHRLVEVFQGKPHIEFELKSTYIMGDDETFPLFKFLYVYVGNLAFCITESQISLMTECGNFIVHSSKHDVEASFIFPFLAKHLKVDESEIKKVFIG